MKVQSQINELTLEDSEDILYGCHSASCENRNGENVAYGRSESQPSSTTSV